MISTRQSPWCVPVRIRFLPAQDRLVATPMAAVVSPSMRMIEMTDLAGTASRCYAPINGGGHGGSPVPRYGRRAPECVGLPPVPQRRVWATCSKTSLPTLCHGCRSSTTALIGGDDTHLRHIAAHTRLIEIFDKRQSANSSNAAANAFVREWPFVHLNFWMAAVRCVLDGASDVAASSLVTAFGGNGEVFGLQVSGLPGRWFTVEATPPLGKLRDGFSAADTGRSIRRQRRDRSIWPGCACTSLCPADARTVRRPPPR